MSIGLFHGFIPSFNPLPAVRPGATYRSGFVYGVAEFQSSPSRKAGSYQSEFHSVLYRGCFNPLPAVRPGATGQAEENLEKASGFNPLPAVRPGATIKFRAIGIILSCFNPLPAVRPGATALPLCASPCTCVSILSQP